MLFLTKIQKVAAVSNQERRATSVCFEECQRDWQIQNQGPIESGTMHKSCT